ncbi:MAG: class I SAM-dependent methyltransferase family protein [Candidatus Nanoarchaeia archaeon]
MVKTLKVKKEEGESARLFLIEKGWLDKTRIVGRTGQRYIILALTPDFKESVLKKKFPGSKIEEKNLQKLAPMPGDLKQLLKDFLPEKYLDLVVKSYDVIGDIAILEIPKSLERFELQIAHALKRANPYLKTVVRKAGKISDEFRIRPLKHLTGEKKTETTHREANVLLKVDLSKAYFSPRSSNERLRIARLVKPGEDVLVMFAGIGVYPLVITKFQQNCHIWAIEKNPDAVKFMEENIRANRAGHLVFAVKGDVKDKMPELGLVYDRIVMPFPEQAFKFLDLAFRYIKPNGTVHYYTFLHEDKIDKHIKALENTAKKLGRKIEIQNWLRTGSFAPRVWRTVFDIRVK